MAPALNRPLRSLGWRSEAMLVALDGRVTGRRRYTVLARPHLPEDAWHNLLVMPRPPRPGDLWPWVLAFDRELGGRPATGHLAFGWDSPTGRPGAVRPFLEAGFELIVSSVHVARRLEAAPAAPGGPGALRPLGGDADWAAALALQRHGAPPGIAADAFDALAEKRMARHRAMAEAGHGAFWGAFEGGALVAACGIFAQGGLARFQAVVTHRDHRRRGHASRLLRAAGAWAQRALGARLLVVTAALGSEAARRYTRLGFAPVERMAGLVRPGPARRVLNDDARFNPKKP